VNSRTQSAITSRPARLLPIMDRALSAAARCHGLLLLFLVCCGVASIGVFAIRDLQSASRGAQEMYIGSVHGLQRIGELQYDIQETRRTTLYALTTSDSNLQVEYADQSRAADQRVKDGIAEYRRQARQPAETALAANLAQDWASYLDVRDEVLASILEGSAREAVSLDLSGGVPAFDRVRLDLHEVKRLYEEDVSQRLDELAASRRRASWRLFGFLGFTFLLSSAAVWVIQRSRMLSAIQLAKLQMEFVASVSHELRTPLAVISSAADNLADGLISGKAASRKYGTILQHQSRNMGGLIDEILLFASTEDGTKRYILQPLQVDAIADAIVFGTERMIKNAGFSLDRNIEANLPPVIGDLAGIAQCLQNLVGNAIKYGGDNRRISLCAFDAPKGDGPDREVRISLTDYGIGIDHAELPRIFDPFYRSPRVQAAQIHGTGLGLSLSKRIADAMGARLSVTSELHAGSTFTLHLSIAKREEIETARQLRGLSTMSPL